VSDKITEEKNERAREEIVASKVDPREKEDSLELISHAENICNGGGSSLEANSRALGALIRYVVRMSIRQQNACGWKYMVLEAKWPIACFLSVGIFSPNFHLVAEILNKVIK